MRTIHTTILSALTAFLLSTVPSVAQETSKVFRARFEATRNSSVNRLIEKSDTIDLSQYLNTLAPIYSLSVDVTIEQPREASFTRIVLEDTEGRDHLVLECDRFRYDQDVVNLREFCQETALLFGIIPKRLKCYVAGNARLTLNAIYVTDQYPQRGLEQIPQKQEEEHKVMRCDQIREIIKNINVYNKLHGLLWRAGETNACRNKYSQNNEYSGEQDAYMGNIKYYIDGIYNIGEPNENATVNRTSTYIPDFDWRMRHGRNMMTHVKDQGLSGYCVAFAINGMLESRVNLYFNQKIDMNLSEQDIVYNYARAGYKMIDSIYTQGMNPTLALGLIINYGVLDSVSVPFVDAMMHTIPSRPYGNECVSISNKSIKYVSSSNDIDDIKSIIIQNGPVVSGFGTSSNWHALTLVGYHTIKAGDTISQVKIPSEGGLFDPIVVPSGSSFIGDVYWVMKDSYGLNEPGRHDGYMYIWFKSYTRMSNVDYTTSPIICRNYTNSDIVCEDSDGDGYFNWGINPTKPSHCPAWASDLSDGDDSDRTKGHMNAYGYCDELSSNLLGYQYVYNDTTLLSTKNWNSYLGIISGATVTIQAQQTFSSGTKLLLDNGATLILKGTVISGNSIQPYPGSKIILNNGAVISKPFEIPLGVELVINNGSIL